MKPLVGDQLATDESWEEYAEHSVTSDDLPGRVTTDEAPRP